MIEELQRIGLNLHEAEVYLALVKSGPTGAGELIKQTGLHRNVVYENLDKLARRDLVSRFKKHKIAQFKALDPENIVQQVESQLEVAKQLVPELARIGTFTQDVTIYEGKEGFQTFNLKLLEDAKSGVTVYVIGTGNLWYEIMDEVYTKWLRLWNKRKASSKAIIYRSSDRNAQVPRYETTLIEQQEEPPADMMVWDDSIALQTLVEPYTVIHIRNKTLASAYKKYFDILWGQANNTIKLNN